MVAFAKDLVSRHVGRHWNSEHTTSNWWTSSRLRAHMNGLISPQNGRGVPGAIEAFPRPGPIGRAISVGAGNGRKERVLVQAGLVEHFDLYELSQTRAETARAAAVAAGLGERIETHVADAFAADTANSYDMVYWDHALHHMMDVDQAVAWSVASLKPGGLLVINDYVGPTRLQWRRREIDFARGFLAEHRARLGAEPGALAYKTVFNRIAMMIRDPSEAPQSDRIEASVERHCGGSRMRRLGGVMIHLCAGFVTPIEDQEDPLYDALIEWDARALDAGFNHFAFMIWQKP